MGLVLLREECICLFGNEVYNDVCAKYELSFRVFSLSNDFMIGYVSSSGDIKNWNNELGRDENLYYSTGIYLYKHLRYFELCNKQNKHGKHMQSLIKTDRKLQKSDTIKMSFDFLKDKFSIYINDGLALQIDDLGRNTQIIPAFGLNDKGDWIAIQKWQFFDKDNNVIRKM